MRRVTWIPGIIIKSCPNPLQVFLNKSPTNTGAPCSDLPGLASLTAHALVPVSDCLLMAGNCLCLVGPRELGVCESASWGCGWELMEQPNSFLKIRCHLFSPIGIYKALETKDSDPSMSVPLLAPRVLGRLRWAWLEQASYKEPLGTCPPNLVIHHHPNPLGTGFVWSRGLPAEAADISLLEQFFF